VWGISARTMRNKGNLDEQEDDQGNLLTLYKVLKVSTSEACQLQSTFAPSVLSKLVFKTRLP
jgi:hypothetical protein